MISEMKRQMYIVWKRWLMDCTNCKKLDPANQRLFGAEMENLKALNASVVRLF